MVAQRRRLECASGFEVDDEALLLQFGKRRWVAVPRLHRSRWRALLLVVAGMVYILRLERQTRNRYLELARAGMNCSSFPRGWWTHRKRSADRSRANLHDEVGQSLGALLVDLSRLSGNPARRIAPKSRNKSTR